MKKNRTAHFLKILWEMDVKNCGARYLCEIGALAVEQRTIQEEAALSLFQVYYPN